MTESLVGAGQGGTGLVIRLVDRNTRLRYEGEALRVDEASEGREKRAALF